jgi:flagellar motor switch protein FliG
MTLAPVSRPGSPRRKAAVAIVALGPERSATLLRGLDEDSVRALAHEVAALGPVEPAEVRAALFDLEAALAAATSLRAPDNDYTRNLLVQALGERGERIADEVNRPAPFTWLAEADVEQASVALAEESAATVALALAHLPAKPAARLLSRLPEALRRKVATRVAQLTTLHPATVSAVEEALQASVTAVLTPSVQPVPGPDVLASMLQFTPKGDEKDLVASLAAVDPELADRVKAALFTFDDLAVLEARALQTLIKACDTRDLALALKSAEAAFRDNILSNMSERAREGLLEEMDLMLTVKPAETAGARKAIVATARQLEEEGTIVIARPDEDAAA